MRRRGAVGGDGEGFGEEVVEAAIEVAVTAVVPAGGARPSVAEGVLDVLQRRPSRRHWVA